MLNPAQHEAVRYLDGPLLVLAGAGSGKTRVITRKIAHLIERCDFSPSHIAAITFTNKAAREMQARVGELLSGRPAPGLTISTFHALGVRILREEIRQLGYKPGFSIFDASDSFSVMAELSKSVDKGFIRHTLQTISHWKNALISPNAAQTEAENDLQAQMAKLYRDYVAALKAYQAVDFDDLIVLPVQLFTEHVAVLDKWQNRLRYLLVDEYQDTNACQYRLLRQLTGVRSMFTAVGDDDQAIYGWRGADIANLRRLTEDYRSLKIIKLEQNYRSSVRILKAANALIAHNEKLFEKRLWSELGTGEAIVIETCRDNEQEADKIVTKLQAHRFEHRTSYADYAILYRGNHQARVFEQKLRDRRIPYRLSGGQSFFDKAEIRDLMAYLRLITNPDDDPAFIRAATTPKRGIGTQTLETLGSYAGERHRSLFAAAGEHALSERLTPARHGPLTQFCDFIGRMGDRARHERPSALLPELLTAIGYLRYLHEHEEARSAAARWGNVTEFCDWLAQKGDEENKNLAELVQAVALANRLDKDGESTPDAVHLSTLHAAKGLEYAHVFLAGVEEGLLPHKESVDGGHIEEERRLMYVGITRARRSLVISYCERRKLAGQWIPCLPSRFIAELGEADLQRSSDAKPVPAEQSRARLDALKAMLNKKI